MIVEQWQWQEARQTTDGNCHHLNVDPPPAQQQNIWRRISYLRFVGSIYLFGRFWISHKFLHDWQFAKTVMSLRDKDASCLVELMLVVAWSVWERIPSCILLTHYWENLDEKQVSKPTSKSGGARPEKVLGWPWNRFGLCDRPVKRGTFLGLLTHVPPTASTHLFFRKWQQNVGISKTIETKKGQCWDNSQFLFGLLFPLTIIFHFMVHWMN